MRNGKKTFLVDNICFALAESIYLETIKDLAYNVQTAPTLEEAEEIFLKLKKHIEENKEKIK